MKMMLSVLALALLSFPPALPAESSAVIEETVHLIEETQGVRLDMQNLPLDDRATYELISRGDVVGVFQLSSGGFQMVCKDLKPDCIDDIIALVVLRARARPARPT